MKRLLPGLVVGLAALLLATPAAAQGPVTSNALGTSRQPLVIGHRGADTAAHPQGALSTFRWAAPYSSYLEFDLRWTADNQPIIAHDVDLSSWTNCTGTVESQQWARIRSCRITGSAETLTPFAQVLTVARSAGVAVLPQLATPYPSDANLAEFLRLVYQEQMQERTRVQGFRLHYLSRLKALDRQKKIRYVYLSSGTTPTYPTPAQVTAYGGVFLASWRAMTREQVADYQDAGVKVWLWTVATPADLEAARDLRPNGIISDDPRMAKAGLGARGVTVPG